MSRYKTPGSHHDPITRDNEAFETVVRIFSGRAPRSPERIQPVIERFRAIWLNHHDMRFFQLIACIQSTVENRTGRDLFNMEEPEVLENLNYILKNGFVAVAKLPDPASDEAEPE